jgi:hypothetical protein
MTGGCTPRFGEDSTAVTVEPRALRRNIRRALRVRGWPWRTKLAIGAWIPAIIVAVALFTGPNAPASDTSATTPTTRGLPKVVSPKLPIPKPVPLEDVIASWVKGAGYRRAPAYVRLARRHKAPKYLTTHPGVGAVARHKQQAK